MTKLEEAIQLAVSAHKGQKDKVGAPYILHPLRLMCRVEGEDEQIAAVLHDVLEDTPVRMEDLEKAGFPAAALEALERLTRRQSESYEQFIDRVMGNPVAIRVKMADLEDNLNVQRLPEVRERDRERLNRYLVALGRLKEAIRRGR
ncbi:MAG: GTP pyrophosphokinase [Candidatus Riflebacteria bacterium]|nr:GTP pyrophosphokinase [Candidatus Riflebacteria bacterium]